MPKIHQHMRAAIAARQDMHTHISRDGAPDPRFTDEANAESRQSWEREHRRRFDQKLDQLRTAAKDDADQLKTAAARKRPHLNLNDTAQLMRTEQAWRNVVLPQLERGRTLPEALRGADADAVLGAERFAHGFYAQKTDLSDAIDARQESYDPARIAADVADWFAAKATSPEDAALLREAARVDRDLAAFEQVAGHLAADRTMDASLLTSMIGREYAPTPDPRQTYRDTTPNKPAEPAEPSEAAG